MVTPPVQNDNTRDMNKKQLLSIPALFAALVMSAQTYTGGVKGTVVDRSSKTAVDGAVLKLYSGAEEIAEVKTAPDGTFMIPSLKDGMYDLVIKTPDYLESSRSNSVKLASSTSLTLRAGVNDSLNIFFT